MARDKVDRSLDPGESEFGGNPDDVRVGIVPMYFAQPVRETLDAYWTNADDPGSAIDPEGSHIGDSGSRQRRDSEAVRENQFHLAPPTYSRRPQ